MEFENMYGYETTCPRCQKHIYRGYLNRPGEQIVELCDCGYEGPLVMRVTGPIPMPRHANQPSELYQPDKPKKGKR